MTEESNLDVEVEVEVEIDEDELEIEVGDTREAEAELEKDGVEIEIELEIEREGGDAAADVEDDTEHGRDTDDYEDAEAMTDDRPTSDVEEVAKETEGDTTTVNDDGGPSLDEP